MNSIPSLTAGVAMQTAPAGFVARTANAGPARTTVVPPSSLVRFQL
jgi:hypothetical protein